MLRLDLRRLEDGKGKSPYDPRHRAASVLVGESKGCDPNRTLGTSQSQDPPPEPQGSLKGPQSSTGPPAESLQLG